MSQKQQSDVCVGDASPGSVSRNLGGLLDLLWSLVERAAVEGGAVSRAGEIGRDGDAVKAVYGLSARVGGASPPVIERSGRGTAAARQRLARSRSAGARR